MTDMLHITYIHLEKVSKSIIYNSNIIEWE